MLGTTVLIVSTDTKVLVSAPDVGGGIDNIAFLVGKPPGGPNGRAIPATSIVWIERCAAAVATSWISFNIRSASS
jgi:hypothetical protein